MTVYNASNAPESLVGSPGNSDDTFVFGTGTANVGDKVDGRGGFDTVEATGDGTTVDLKPIGAHFTSIEQLKIDDGVTVLLDSGNIGGGTGRLPLNLTLDGDGSGVSTVSFGMSGGALNLSGLQFGPHWESGTDVINVWGTVNADTITGSSTGDTLLGGAGNDIIRGAGGNDVIDGGTDVDTAVLSTPATAIVSTSVGWQVTSADGVDQLRNVEIIDDSQHRTLLVGKGGFDTIQAAVDAAQNGDTILIANGDYHEQVVIDGKGDLKLVGESENGVTIHAPAGTVAQTGSDPLTGKAIHALVQVHDSTNVTIGNLTVDGDSSANNIAVNGGDYVGIAYLDASGNIDHVATREFRDPLVNATTVSGIQRGTDILSSNASDAPNSLEVSNSTITDFQKTGIVARNTDVYIHDNDIQGFGPQDIIAQNGISLTNGASGEISGNTIGGLGFTPSTNTVVGVLAFGAGEGLVVTGNSFSGTGVNDTGVYLYQTHGASVMDNSFDGHAYGIVDLDNADAPNLVTNQGPGANSFNNIVDTGYDLEPTATNPAAFVADGTGFDDYMQGGQAADTLHGFGGSDSLFGGDGNDLLVGGAGDDSLDGGSGFDTAQYSSPVTYTTDGTSWTATAAGEGTDTLVNIESVVDGSGHATLLVGSGGFATIQAAIDAANPGDTIEIAAGSYQENVNVNKADLKLVGLGTVKVQGTFLTDNGVGSTALHTWLESHSSYTGAAGDGITIAANGVSLTNIDIDGFLHAIRFATDTADTTLNQIDISRSVFGIEKSTTADIDGLTVNGGSITDGYIGIDFAKATGPGNETDGVARNVTIDGTHFTDITQKGIYVETLTDSLIDNIVAENVGQYGGGPAFGADGRAGNAINLNLKAGTYGNIVIEDFHLTDTGASDKNGASATGDKNGGAIVIEARDDGASYGSAPAVVTDAVIIRNGVIDGHTSTGIQVGEPGKANADPDVDVSNVTISGADHAGLHGDIGNESQSTLTFNGTGGDDVIVTSNSSSGAIVFAGGAGNDSFTGHNEFDTAHFDVTLAASAFSANGSAWVVSAGAEGTDTVSGVELVTDNAGHRFLLVGSGGYQTIQAAVDAANEGDTILVAAGTYQETVTVTKGVDILGAKFGIAGATAGRGVGDGAGETSVEGRFIINTTHAVILDGLRYVDSAASGVNGFSQPSVYIQQSGVGAAHEILNSVFYSTVAGGASSENDIGVYVGGAASGEVSITGNYFTGSTLGKYETAAWGRGVWSDGGGQTLNIEDNTFQSTRSAINLDTYNDATTNVSGNAFVLAGTAISVGIPTGGTYAGIHDNLFQDADADLNLQNVSPAATVDVAGTNNITTPGQAFYLLGTGGDDTIVGSTGVDYLQGNGGNDSLKGGAGDDTLDGGAGTSDTAVYSQTITAGMITADSGNFKVTTGGAEGTDTLIGIEFVTDGVHTYSLSGTNSPVTFTTAAAPNSVTEDVGVVSGALSASTSSTFSDLDPGDTHSVSGTIDKSGSNAHAAGIAAGLVEGTDFSLTATVNEASHTVDYHWSIFNSAINALADGETITLTAHETISDGASSAAQDVAITINGHNDAPQTSPVDLLTIAEDSPLIITKASLLANATDAESQPLDVSGLTASTGALVDNGDGTYTYTPVANFSGPVNFTYGITDGTDTTSASATLSISPISDTPNLTLADASGNEGSSIPLAINAALVDTDGSETLAVQISGVPTGASLSAGTNNSGGVWTLTPAQLAGLSLTPAAGYNGDFTLHVQATATDGAAVPASAAGDVHVHVEAGSGGIVAAADTLVVTRDLVSALDLSALLANDTGGTGPLSVTGFSNITGGSVTIDGGKLAITATAGAGAFDYTVSDTGGHSQTGHVSFTSLVTDDNANTLNAGSATAADLQARGGADYLIGSSGADRLVGGDGSDRYVVNHVGDQVIEALNQGTDSVSASVTHTLSANVEYLTLTGSSAIDGTGNELNNVMVGNGAANTLNGAAGTDALDGGAGNDHLIGGAGADRVAGGAGNDTFVFNAGDLMPTTAAFDQISDFRGVGSTGSEQDVIELHGFGAGTTLSFVQSLNTFTSGAGEQINQQLYHLTDATDPSHNGYVLVGIVGSTNHLATSDILFT